MASISLRAPVDGVCAICRTDTQLDDFGRCQDCVESAELRAITLDDIDQAVTEAMDGLTADQIRQAVELVLANAEGQIAGDIVGREVIPANYGNPVVWRLVEPSIWLQEDRANRIYDVRRASRMSRQRLAETMGVDVATIAAWERELRPDRPSREQIDKLCDLFGVTALHLFPEDN